ncbi:MAG: SufS family cysteine desulfurase [Armatimonadetes bacterium]|nr:SufS family cysteine desulfurase [Armatimonadota bacterium]
MVGKDLHPQFPILERQVHGRALAYLDNAATMQRPDCVLAAMDAFSRSCNANVHRGVHTLSQEATDAFESARDRVRTFVNAKESAEIIWTKGCTESLNLVAHSWGAANLGPGDEILLSTMEHHANIVPWQLAANRVGAQVKPIPIDDDCQIDLGALQRMLSGPVKVVGVKHVCNATGRVNPVAEIARMAHDVGAVAVVDGAQALAHVQVDVQALGADFYAMSSHKVYGPMGMGALYGRRELLDSMPPFQGGGDMIRSVSFDGTTFNTIPNRFEPGTPHVDGAIGFSRALDWMVENGVEAIACHENELAEACRKALREIPGVRLVAEGGEKAAVVSFVTEFAHPHDVGTVLDRHGVAVRTGHHCCMPLMDRLGIPGTVRASFAAYNTDVDLKVLIEGVLATRGIFA